MLSADTSLVVLLVTSLVGVIGWLGRELYKERTAKRDEDVDSTQQNLDSLTKEVRSLEDEMVTSDEALRERIEAGLLEVRSYVDAEFVRVGQFRLLQKHIDDRFNSMETNQIEIKEALRDLTKNITSS